jgi:hypothetical protein
MNVKGALSGHLLILIKMACLTKMTCIKLDKDQMLILV